MTIIRLDALGHKDQAGAHEIIEAARGVLAFDIGANVGTTASVLARGFDKVIALEPCQESYDILLAEMPHNVVCMMVAATDRTGVVTLNESEYSINSGQLTSGDGLSYGALLGQRDVPAVTIDELVAESGQPDFVKIDTEGHEVEVLLGWNGPKCDVLIEVHGAANEGIVRNVWGAPLRKLSHDPKVGKRAYENHCWLTTVDA